jgi:hypothetical protein
MVWAFELSRFLRGRDVWLLFMRWLNVRAVVWLIHPSIGWLAKKMIWRFVKGLPKSAHQAITLRADTLLASPGG